jgi:hypothetical protein
VTPSPNKKPATSSLFTPVKVETPRPQPQTSVFDGFKRIH